VTKKSVPDLKYQCIQTHESITLPLFSSILKPLHVSKKTITLPTLCKARPLISPKSSYP